MTKRRVLSGVRPTGCIHLGNYLGAIEGMLKLQENPSYETFFMVADYHSINTPYDRDELKENVKNIVLDYLAVGLDPKKSVIFIQSHVPEHIELSYLFSSVLTVSRMIHLPTYKEKVKENPQNANMAMFYYPVLMAADILIYKASLVPVGDDQLPHLEVAREIARKMNKKYKTDFPLPVQFKTAGSVVPSLTGVGKMSKSVEGSYITLYEDFSEIRKKIAKIPTDSGKGKVIPKEGGVYALFKLVSLFLGKEREDYYKRKYLSEGVSYAKLKEELSLSIFNFLRPFQEKRKKLEKKEHFIKEVIEDGAKKAQKIASQTLSEVKEAMGIVY